MFFFGPSWKGFPIFFKLFIKCLFPPAVLYWYLFGLSDTWVYKCFTGKKDALTVDKLGEEVQNLKEEAVTDVIEPEPVASTS